MNPLKVWQEWTEEVGRLASCATVWQQRALALFSLGLAVVQDCSMAQVAAAVLEQARGQPVWLALDETPQGHASDGPRLQTLALRLLYRERAIPLAWVC